MRPKSGNPTPVTINPKAAIPQELPKLCPNMGGKIKFPAPNNIANNAKPVNTTSFLLTILSLTFSCFLKYSIHFIIQLYYLDRKSTRLNSSHANISYAVFCLKKKKKLNINFIDCH